MSSTVSYPVSAAKRTTSSSPRSGRIALTNPSCMLSLLSRRLDLDPSLLAMAPQDGLAEDDLPVSVGEGREGGGIDVVPLGDGPVEGPEELLERVGVALDVPAGVVREAARRPADE